MRRNIGRVVAVFGSALTALSLTGSTQVPANDPTKSNDPAAVELRAVGLSANRLFKEGRYLEAREAFLRAASLGIHSGWPRVGAPALNAAGGCALARRDFRDALADFMQARQTAGALRQFDVLARTLNNLASLYLQMGNSGAAMRMAQEGLAVPSSGQDPTIRPRLRFQLAGALAHLRRFDEARPVYRAVIDEFDEQGDVDSIARVLTSLGSAALDAGHVDEADAALTEALRLARMHRLGAANILRSLARVKARIGDSRAAAALFDAAVAAPPGVTPQWVIYADRGDFRLLHDDLSGALADFRAASRLVSLMRADIVPADQDRVALESGLSRVAAGLVEAGNRFARQTSDKAILRETFDAAERDRLWSLRALIPAPNDWRTRLPQRYWDLLARYQSLELSLLSRPSKELADGTAALRLELQQIEGTAGGTNTRPGGANSDNGPDAVSPLAIAQSALDSDSILLSFHLTDGSGWVWAADRKRVETYQVPPLRRLKTDVAAFTEALKRGDPSARETGRRLYEQLFGRIPSSYLEHKRWLLELDGPLFDLPFAALIVRGSADRSAGDVYLVERAALQAVPSALMLQRSPGSRMGTLLEVGDPVYNAADARYRGVRNGASQTAVVSLPRLTGTAGELEACRRAWGADRTRVLAGPDAGLAGVHAAIASNPSVIHFATHVIAGPDEFSSGLIALSLDSSGAMGLMGPTEIVARPVTSSLVVLNGCHSARGDTLPGTGLMGLTRAWLGAGAGAVLATRWDIPDDAGQALIAAFYRNLSKNWDRGPAFALREAQLELLRNNPARNKSDLLGAYFLLGRV